MQVGGFKAIWRKLADAVGKKLGKKIPATPETGKMAQDALKLSSEASTKVAAGKVADYTGPKFADFTFEKGVYPQDLPRAHAAVKEFMEKFVSPDHVGRFEFKSWTMPDDGQLVVKFHDIKDAKLFQEKILPDLRRWLAERI